MALNYDKTNELRIRFKRSQLDIQPLTINDRPIEQVKSTRLLGVTLTADLKWHSHIDEITAKASQRLYFIILLNRVGVESHHLDNMYTSLVRSVVEYTCQVWHTSLTKQQTKQLESIQRRAVRITEMCLTPSHRHSGNPNTGRPGGDTGRPGGNTGRPQGNTIQNSICEHVNREPTRATRGNCNLIVSPLLVCTQFNALHLILSFSFIYMQLNALNVIQIYIIFIYMQ